MSANALGQPMEHWRNLDLGLKHLEAPLDVGQALVAIHDIDGLEVRHIRDQQQLAIHHLRTGQGLGVDVVGEEVGLQIDLDDLGQMGLGHLVEEAGLGARVTELAASMNFAGILPIKLTHHVHGARLKRGNARGAKPGQRGPNPRSACRL